LDRLPPTADEGRLTIQGQAIKEVETMNELIELKERFEGIVQSTEKFPVDFDEAWRWVEYSTKQKAKEALEKNFEEGFDFRLTGKLSEQSGRGGQNIKKYFLTADCFKSFCMMAGTAKGKEVRLYYIKIEKAWNTPELVMVRARQMGAIPQPEPEKSWCPYPFFNQPNAESLLEKLIEVCNKGYCTPGEFNRAVFYLPDADPFKTTPGIDCSIKAVPAEKSIIRRTRKLNPFVIGFAENFLDITGMENNFLLVQEVYIKFKEAVGTQISRNVFVRQLKDIDTRIVYKQKKIDGVPKLVFFGIKFKE
jgi:phage anti-repressor protein